MKSALHLISDEKFLVSHINKFEINGVENKFILLTNDLKNQKLASLEVTVIKYESEEFETLKKNYKNFDIIFIYMYDERKSYFIKNKLPHQKILWHFYGFDIYSRLEFENEFYAEETLAFKLKTEQKKIYHNTVFYKLYRTYKKRKEHKRFLNILSKIDCFLWYNEDEYKYIKSKFEHFPPFVGIPVSSSHVSYDSIVKENKIIVGNSRSINNNHIDVIKLLASGRTSLEISIPYSYGSINAYSEHVEQLLKDSGLHYSLLTDFMSIDQYSFHIASSKAMIIYSYRQMALGNIAIALINGVKVYLSERNVVYRWLKNNNLEVFSVENDLMNDLARQNLELPEDLIQSNKLNYKVLAGKFADYKSNILIFMK